MIKVGIITIIDNENCGNRLQNYALQEVLKNLNIKAITLKNDKLLNSPNQYPINYLRYIKKKVLNFILGNRELKRNFREFNNHIKFSKTKITCKTKNIKNKYDYFIVGSDQVWKPTRKRMSDIDLLKFANNNQKIAYAASFGIDEIDEKSKQKLRKELPKFKSISVRENAGKRIIETVTALKNIEVVLDPTMLLTSEDWKKLEHCPFKEEKNNYVLAYFLGNETLDKLKNICKKQKLKLINFYAEKNNYGPMEFLYLIHHAKLIVTDSFHGSVFSIIYHKDFYVLNRIEKDKNNDMTSRLETLLNGLNINDRWLNNIKMIDLNNNINFSEVEKLLSIKKEKSIAFLKKNLK